VWAPQVLYQVDDEVEYQGVVYRAVQGHQSQPGWEPPNVPALWASVN
jgi:streptogrisin C